MPSFGSFMKPAVSAGRFGGRAALMLGAAAVSFGAAAGVAAMGAASAIGGGNIFEGVTHDLGHFQPTTPMLARRLQNATAIGALAVGAGQGARQATGGGWNLNQSISTGMVEVERPHFLGATGSLTIASSRRRRAPQEPPMNVARMAGIYGDDALHVARMMVGGH